MRLRNGLLSFAFAALIVTGTAGTAEAARARFHYVPADAAGTMRLQPSPLGSPGERVTLFGTSPYNCVVRTNCVKSFRHPCTGQTVQVPLYMPYDIPVIYHHPDRVVYTYTSDFIEVRFLPDGSVYVSYSSGLLREV